MSEDNKEQSFTVQPHPAKDNNPSGLQGDPSESSNGAGLRASNPNAMAMPGPTLLSEKQVEGLEKPKSREELRAEAEKLNS